MKTIKGDIFKLMQKGDAMMHGCNTHGVMGSGIAATVRTLYPEAYNAYRGVYETSGLELGQVIPVFTGDGKIIINAMTQDFYGRDSKRYASYDAIAECCVRIVRGIDVLNEKPEYLYSPLIGAGLGGGNWNIIKEILREELANKLTETELVIVEFQP